MKLSKDVITDENPDNENTMIEFHQLFVQNNLEENNSKQIIENKLYWKVEKKIENIKIKL